MHAQVEQRQLIVFVVNESIDWSIICTGKKRILEKKLWNDKELELNPRTNKKKKDKRVRVELYIKILPSCASE